MELGDVLLVARVEGVLKSFCSLVIAGFGLEADENVVTEAAIGVDERER